MTLQYVVNFSMENNCSPPPLDSPNLPFEELASLKSHPRCCSLRVRQSEDEKEKFRMRGKVAAKQTSLRASFDASDQISKI